MVLKCPPSLNGGVCRTPPLGRPDSLSTADTKSFATNDQQQHIANPPQLERASEGDDDRVPVLFTTTVVPIESFPEHGVFLQNKLSHSTSTESPLIGQSEMRLHTRLWCVVALLASLSLLAVYSMAVHFRMSQMCLTPDCVKEAAKIIQSIDPSVSPCDDFYQFCCGQWMRTTQIPEHKAIENKFDMLADSLVRDLRDWLESDSDTSTDFEVKMKTFYQSCMDVEAIEKQGTGPLWDLLERLGGWPVLMGDEWRPQGSFSLVHIHKALIDLGLLDDMVVSLTVAPHDKDNSRNALGISHPTFGMLDREFMVKNASDSSVEAYFMLMLYSVQMLHEQKQFDDSRNAEKQSNDTWLYKQSNRAFTFELDDIQLDPKMVEEMRHTLEFERTLALHSMKKDENRNLTLLFNNMTVAELNRMTPNIDWLKLLNIYAVKEIEENEEVVVFDINYVKSLDEVIVTTPQRTITNYIIWRVVKSKIGKLDSNWQELKQTYSAMNLGKVKDEPRWMQCVSQVQNNLGAAVSNVYVKDHFSTDDKDALVQLVLQLQSIFKETLKKTEWMDDQTKQHALDKLDSMNFRIGFPDEILNDEVISEYYRMLEFEEDNYFDNIIAIHKFNLHNLFHSLLEPNSRDDWRKFSEVVDVNAYYYHQENTFILNAGLLQEVFFRSDRPNYLNYGSIGEIIGHEITHGFDSFGKQFDKTGKLQNWWNPLTAKMFEEKAACIVKQYADFRVERVDMAVNGINTQDENIADNGGVAFAYQAYKQTRPLVERHLPGLNFTTEQLFWISYGMENCEKMTDEMLKLTLHMDTHSPGIFRLNGVVANSADFARDFHCPVNSPMNPQVKCKVW